MFDAFSALRNDRDSFVSVLTPDHLGLIRQYVQAASPPPTGTEDPYRDLVEKLSKSICFSKLDTATLAELTGMTVDALAKLIQDLRSTDEPETDVYNQTDIHKHISREELPIAITIAAYLGKKDLLELLIFAFETARPYQQDTTQWKALALAAYAGHENCINLLFNFHLKLSILRGRHKGIIYDNEPIDFYFIYDAIMGSIYFDRSDIFQAISLLIGSLPSNDISESINYSSLLEKAITLKRFNVAIKLLPFYEAKLRKAGNFDSASFFRMYLSCENAVVRSLLINAIRGVINQDRDGKGYNLLHYLCLNHKNKKGFEILLIELLKLGVRLDQVDKDSATPLECLPHDVMVKILRSIPEALRASIPTHLLRYFENDTETSPASVAVVAREEAASAASSAEVPTVPSSTPAASPAASASSAAASPAPVGGWFYSVLGTVRYISDRVDGKHNTEAPAPQRNTGHR